MDQGETYIARDVEGLLCFVGEFTHALDGKMRLTVPSVWRDQLGEKRALFVLPDLHRPCLNLYPASTLMKTLERLRERAWLGDEPAMRFATELGAASDLVTLDAHGRMRIRDKLLRFASLESQVTLVGAIDKFQMWAPGVRREVLTIDQGALLSAKQESGL